MKHLKTTTKDEADKFLSTLRDLGRPGPFCKTHGITKRLLEIEENPQYNQLDTLSVGLLLELDKFCQQQSFKGSKLLSWLQMICSSQKLHEVSVQTVQNEVKNLREDLKALRGNKKPGADSMFLGNASRLTPVPLLSPQDTG